MYGVYHILVKHNANGNILIIHITPKTFTAAIIITIATVNVIVTCIVSRNHHRCMIALFKAVERGVEYRYGLCCRVYKMPVFVRVHKRILALACRRKRQLAVQKRIVGVRLPVQRYGEAIGVEITARKRSDFYRSTPPASGTLLFAALIVTFVSGTVTSKSST